jgi:hypothetical protein
MKQITSKHPVDPNTLESFKFTDRVTVKDYGSKVTDIFFFYRAFMFFANLKKVITKKFRSKPRKQFFKKPGSMREIPSSDSSSGESGDAADD